MTAYNVVRFRTKPGKEKAFVDAHEKISLNAKGFRKGALIKTGERTFCMVGEWNDMDSLAAARPSMIGVLDTFRDMLEDLGGDLGVTDPVSGRLWRKYAEQGPQSRYRQNPFRGKMCLAVAGKVAGPSRQADSR